MSKAKSSNGTNALIVGGMSIAFAIIIIGGIVWGVKHTSTSADKRLRVVAGENFWGNIASQIGGKDVVVDSIMSNPSTDPHLYEADAKDALMLSRANIVIENGLGYDSFMDKLIAASPNSQRHLLSAAKVLNVTGEDPNPHLWYDVPRVPKVADAIEQALATSDPTHKLAYEANLATFKKSLQPILDVTQQIRTNYPAAPVAYTERVPGYLLANAGLTVKTPVSFAAAIEAGNDPSPNDTAAMDALMTSHVVRVLLYNSQATSNVTQHVRDLARTSGVPVIGVTETLPSSERSYQSWQFNQTKALLMALGESS